MHGQLRPIVDEASFVWQCKSEAAKVMIRDMWFQDFLIIMSSDLTHIPPI